MGKGSKRRPPAVSRETIAESWDRIFRKESDNKGGDMSKDRIGSLCPSDADFSKSKPAGVVEFYGQSNDDALYVNLDEPIAVASESKLTAYTKVIAQRSEELAADMRAALAKTGQQQDAK